MQKVNACDVSMPQEGLVGNRVIPQRAYGTWCWPWSGRSQCSSARAWTL